MSNSHSASLRAIVRGRVQGVGFREFVLTRARSLSRKGYALNLADGRSVEVLAEGELADLDRLVVYLRQGPRLSRVDSVELHWGDATGLHEGFSLTS